MPVTHDHINTTISVNVGQSFTMQGIADAIRNAYPPGVNVTGITIPLLSIACKTDGVIDPISDIMAAVTRIYNFLMQSFVNPIWTALYSIYQQLKKLGLGVLDLSIGVLNLHISDLFNPNIYSIIETAVTDLYHHAYNQLMNVLDILNIPRQIINDIISAEKQLEIIIKNIFVSLWPALIKKVKQLVDYIQEGLALLGSYYDIFKAAVDKFLGKIINLLAHPPTINDIYQALLKLAQQYYNKVAGITCWDIIQIIEQFSLPIFGLPLDYKLPLNKSVNMPCVDLPHILSDMMIWINNFLLNIVKKFMAAITDILNYFGLAIKFPTIQIPITLCVTNIS
jgi:hypothetical protein